MVWSLCDQVLIAQTLLLETRVPTTMSRGGFRGSWGCMPPLGLHRYIEQYAYYTLQQYI